jgi:hypothetical protein
MFNVGDILQAYSEDKYTVLYVHVKGPWYDIRDRAGYTYYKQSLSHGWRVVGKIKFEDTYNLLMKENNIRI